MAATPSRSALLIAGLILFVLPESNSASRASEQNFPVFPGRPWSGQLSGNGNSGRFAGPSVSFVGPFTPFTGSSGPFFRPQWPPGFFPRPLIFVGSFQSDPVTEPQVNMWRVYTASGLPTEFVNEIIATNITLEGNQSTPSTYRIVETALASNQIIRDFVFQLGIPNNAVINGDTVQYVVQAEHGDRLSLSFNGNSSGTSRIIFDFEFGGYLAIYNIGNVTGTRGFSRI